MLSAPWVIGRRNIHLHGTSGSPSFFDNTNNDKRCIFIPVFASGTGGTQSVIQLNGSQFSVYEHFAVWGNSLIPPLAGIMLDTHAGGIGSTTRNVFRDLSNWGAIENSGTNGYAGQIVPIADLTTSTASISTASVPANLFPNQSIAIFDDSGNGDEIVYVAANWTPGANPITLAHAPKTCHAVAGDGSLCTGVGGNASVRYNNNIGQLGFIGTNAGCNGNDDINNFDAIGAIQVDTAFDQRCNQSVENVIHNITCTNCSLVFALPNGGSIAAYGVEQNNTSVGWWVSNGGRLLINDWSPQPDISQAAGTYYIGWSQAAQIRGTQIQVSLASIQNSDGVFLSAGQGSGVTSIDLGLLIFDSAGIPGHDRLTTNGAFMALDRSRQPHHKSGAYLHHASTGDSIYRGCHRRGRVRG